MSNNQLPTPIKLNESEAKILSDLADDMVALQNWMDLITEQGKMKIQEYRQKTAAAWQELDKTYDLDITHTHWVLSNDKKSIVPVGIKLENMDMSHPPFAGNPANS